LPELPVAIGWIALPTFAPMLASTQPPAAGADWAFEPKLDGWRAPEKG
jgi:ATP-dependent DNA ligase